MAKFENQKTRRGSKQYISYGKRENAYLEEFEESVKCPIAT